MVSLARFMALMALAVLGMGEGVMRHMGTLQVAKKQVVAKDMIHILEQIYRNAKYADFPDIKEEKGKAIFKKGMYITDIDPKDISFDSREWVSRLKVDEGEGKISLESDKPILVYVFHFKWVVKVFGASYAFGEGKVKATSTKLISEYFVKSKPLSSKVDAAFKAELVSISGNSVLTPGLEEWIMGKFVEIVLPRLSEGVRYNTRFVHEYMGTTFKKEERRVEGDHVIGYNSFPYNVTEDGDWVLVAYQTNTTVDKEVEETLSLKSIVDSHKGQLEQFDMAFISSPHLIPMTMNLHGKLKLCNGEFDLKKIGYSGTVKDLFGPIPRLAALYNGNEGLKMNCEYVYKPVTIMEDCNVLFPTKCNISILKPEPETLLSFASDLRIKYAPAVLKEMNDYFGALLSEVRPVKIESTPQGLEVTLFLMELVHKFGQSRFQGKTLEIPRIQYYPWRGGDFKGAAVEQGQYVTFYNELSGQAPLKPLT